MVSRAESAAATRRALLDAAAELLDLGGRSAVTVRAVGARAGVTRGAPYRHFADKDGLLAAVAAQGWERMAAQVQAVRSDPLLSDPERLSTTLRALVGVGRERPHLFRMMCSAPAGDQTAVVHAAGRYRDEVLAVVAAVVGERDAGRYGALLLASTYGIADMELSGHLAADTWRTTAEELVDTVVRMVADPGGAA